MDPVKPNPYSPDPDLPDVAAIYQPNHKRSFVLNGHATSVALEPIFWERLEAMANTQGLTLHQLIEFFDQQRGALGGLASFLRTAAATDLLAANDFSQNS